MGGDRPVSFKDQSWGHRFTKLGDEAEGVFEAVYPQGKVKFGLSRPSINLTNVPAFVRYTPDYVTAKGLVEVQGFGRDQTFKLKMDKYEALNQWHLQFRVDLFVWDSHNRRYGFVRLHDFMDAWEAHGDTRSFPEGKEYMALEAEHLPVDEWVEYDPLEAVG